MRYHYPEDGDIADDVTDNHKRERPTRCLARPRMKDTGTRRTGGRRVAVEKVMSGDISYSFFEWMPVKDTIVWMVEHSSHLGWSRSA